jgi:hypothetical protein
VFRGSTMQVVRRIRPHASRSATAPGNLPISDTPALPLPRATPLAVPTLRRGRGSSRPPRSQPHVLHRAARVEPAQTRKARSLSERFRNDWICRANLTRPSDQVTSSAKRLISAIGAGIHVTFVLVRRPLRLVGETKIAPVPQNVAALRSARLAISFRWLRQRRDPGLFSFPELGIPHTFERPL